MPREFLPPLINSLALIGGWAFVHYIRTEIGDNDIQQFDNLMFSAVYAILLSIVVGLFLSPWVIVPGVDDADIFAAIPVGVLIAGYLLGYHLDVFMEDTTEVLESIAEMAPLVEKSGYPAIVLWFSGAGIYTLIVSLGLSYNGLPAQFAIKILRVFVSALFVLWTIGLVWDNVWIITQKFFKEYLH